MGGGVFGNVRIGDDVLISPNTVVNFDVPSHSVVYGNPAVVKHRLLATEGYVSKQALQQYFGDYDEKKRIINKL